MYDEKQKKATIRYMRENYKRVPLDLRNEDYAELKAYCEKHDFTINGFIKMLIMDAIQKEPPV